jgi:hypothetical protein
MYVYGWTKVCRIAGKTAATSLVLFCTGLSSAAEPADEDAWETAAEPPSEPATPETPSPAEPPQDTTAPAVTFANASPATSDPTADTTTPGSEPAKGERKVEKRVLHGFRLGYLHISNYDKRIPDDDGTCDDCSIKDRYGLRTPHQFLLGYEVMGRLVGHGWLNVLLVGNLLVSGLEQSKFLPSANFLIGFELDQSFQVGVGTNLTLERDKPAHMVLAAGWTPRVGSFHVPIHAFFVPDVDQNHRSGMTVGVNW